MLILKEIKPSEKRKDKSAEVVAVSGHLVVSDRKLEIINCDFKLEIAICDLKFKM